MLKTIFTIAFITSRMMYPGIPVIPTQAGGETADFSNVSQSVRADVAYDGSDEPAVNFLMPGENAKPLKINMLRINKAQSKDSAANRPGGPVINLYSGVGNAVEKGQPKSLDRTELKSMAMGVIGNEHGFAGHMQRSAKLPKVMTSAKAEGTYTFETNFADKVTAEVKGAYLAPTEFLDLQKGYDLTKPLPLKWKPVEGAVGYAVNAEGSVKGARVRWTAGAMESHVDTMFPGKVPPEVFKKNMKTWLLPAKTCECVIPAGIFNGSTTIKVSVTAYGAPDIRDTAAGIVNIVYKSTVTAPISAAREETAK